MPHQRSTEQFELNDMLCQNKFCESLTIREVNTFLEFTETVSFQKGDIITDFGDALYFVIEGVTGLFHDNQPRSTRIRAMKANNRLLRISKTMYNRLRVKHPDISVLAARTGNHESWPPVPRCQHGYRQL